MKNTTFNEILIAELTQEKFLELYGNRMKNALEFWQNCVKKHGRKNSDLQETKQFTESIEVGGVVSTGLGKSKRSRKNSDS